MIESEYIRRHNIHTQLNAMHNERKCKYISLYQIGGKVRKRANIFYMITMFGLRIDLVNFIHGETIKFIRHFADASPYNRFIQIKSQTKLISMHKQTKNMKRKPNTPKSKRYTAECVCTLFSHFTLLLVVDNCEDDRSTTTFLSASLTRLQRQMSFQNNNNNHNDEYRESDA